MTFDEDDGTDANHIPTVFAGQMVRAGDTTDRIDHYRILRTIEDRYQLVAPGRAATVPAITGIWTPAK